MKRLATLISIFACLNAFGENVTITGKVTKGSDPVAGARITLKNHPTVSALTGADGAFTLSGNTPVLVDYRMTTANGIGIKAMKNGSGIIVRTASPAFGKVDVYKMNGRMVASRMLDKACPADYAIAFGKAGAEAYVVKVTTGNQTCISRFVPGIGASGSAIANGKTGISAAALGKRTAVSDSVVAFARGFKTAVQAITAYEKTGVDFSLSACSLWVPTGALTHKKSMVKISAKGYNFEMGQSDIKALGVDANGYMNAEFELPPHNVTFARDFWMDTTEVTQGEFDRLMKKYYPTYATPKWDATHGIGDNYPVYFESWTNAALFCNARSKEDSLDTVYGYASISGTVGTETVVLKSISVNTSAKGYRLPTEAEWEYAYRGGKTTDFFWSKNLEDYKTATAFADVDSHAVWKKVSFDKGAGNPGYGVRVVASTSPNNYGLYDIAGNTSEWYHDSFDSYTWDAVTDSVKKVTSSETSKHSLRGGNWASDVNSLRAAVRYFDSGSDYYQFLWGFRTARTSED